MIGCLSLDFLRALFISIIWIQFYNITLTKGKVKGKGHLYLYVIRAFYSYSDNCFYTINARLIFNVSIDIFNGNEYIFTKILKTNL